MSNTLMTCSCLGTQEIDTEALAEATGMRVAPMCSELCGSQIETAAKALAGGDAVICCAQESKTFSALAEELDVPSPALLDLRDRAGWTEDTSSTVPKMAALTAEALLPSPGGKILDVVSDGLCLVLGGPETALAAAEALKDHLSVTVLLADPIEIPDARAFDVVVGNLRGVTGALGGFEIRIDALRQVEPGGRGPLTFSEPRNGAKTECDLILDLRDGAPLFAAHEKREGYLKADPAHAPSVSAAILSASHMVGTFEKPLYVRTEPALCAHSRARQTGCTRCLDLCPTGAITPDGDHVSVDPMVCAGCGACSSVCPSGAISYDAPPVDFLVRRIQALAKAYLDAGGSKPRLLVHDAFGGEMIRLSARYGRGLPADVIPMEVDELGVCGHAEVLAGLAAGFASVSIVPGREADLAALNVQAALARAVGGVESVQLIETEDPDVLSDTLYDENAPESVSTPVRPMGTRRQITRQAARALAPETECIELPEGAPYGAIEVDKEACTLCLSCVSLCPSGALGDNPDLPQLRFQEDACLQCGICRSVCPEDAIALKPQLDLTDAALRQEVLNEEEPFACVECGVLFGSKSTIERITEKLTNHSMFASEDKLRMIQMCDNCRVNAQFHSEDNPFAAGTRPRPRTTADYMSKRRDH